MNAIFWQWMWLVLFFSGSSNTMIVSEEKHNTQITWQVCLHCKVQVNKQWYTCASTLTLYGFTYVRDCCTVFCSNFQVLFQLSSAYTERQRSIPFDEINTMTDFMHWSFYYDNSMAIEWYRSLACMHGMLFLGHCKFSFASLFRFVFCLQSESISFIECIVLRWPHKLLHYYNV